MGIIKNIFGAFGKKATTSAVQTLVSLDPDTASDVQVRQYKDAVDQRATILVNAKQRTSSISDKLQSQNARLDAIKKGVSNLLKKEQTPDIASAVESGLKDGEQLKQDIAKTTADLANATAFQEKAEADHKKSVQVWVQAKDNLARKQAENADLKLDLDRAKEEKKDAEIANGLDTSINTATIVDDAFTKKANELKAEIEKNRVTTTQLNAPTSNSILEKAIKDADSENTESLSSSERLARL